MNKTTQKSKFCNLEMLWISACIAKIIWLFFFPLKRWNFGKDEVKMKFWYMRFRTVEALSESIKDFSAAYCFLFLSPIFIVSFWIFDKLTRIFSWSLNKPFSMKLSISASIMVKSKFKLILKLKFKLNQEQKLALQLQSSVWL